MKRKISAAMRKGIAKREVTRQRNNAKSGKVKLPKLTAAQLMANIEKVVEKAQKADSDTISRGDAIRSNFSPWGLKARRVG